AGARILRRTPLAARDCGGGPCRGDGRLFCLGLYVVASDAIGHPPGRGTHFYPGALGARYVSSPAPSGAPGSSLCPPRDLESAAERVVLHRVFVTPRTLADRATAGQYFRAFRLHADCS